MKLDDEEEKKGQGSVILFALAIIFSLAWAIGTHFGVV